MSVSETKRLRELDRENARLKKLLAERTLLQGKFSVKSMYGHYVKHILIERTRKWVEI